MKILVIDEWIPWPLESGKKIRTYNLIRRLADKHTIFFLAYADLPGEQGKADLLSKNGIIFVPVKDNRTKKWTIPFYLQIIFNFFSRDPFSSAYHITENFIEANGRHYHFLLEGLLETQILLRDRGIKLIIRLCSLRYF